MEIYKFIIEIADPITAPAAGPRLEPKLSLPDYVCVTAILPIPCKATWVGWLTVYLA